MDRQCAAVVSAPALFFIYAHKKAIYAHVLTVVSKIKHSVDLICM
jgi:hypothetical protein